MTKLTGTPGPDDQSSDQIPRYGDWITWAIVLLGAAIVLTATSELWLWHPWR